MIRLTVYAREDELDIMRLVGATRAYVKGPFVVEGMVRHLVDRINEMATERVRRAPQTLPSR